MIFYCNFIWLTFSVINIDNQVGWLDLKVARSVSQPS